MICLHWNHVQFISFNIVFAGWKKRALQPTYKLKVVPFKANKSKKSSSPNTRMHETNTQECTACIRSEASERGATRKHSGNKPLFSLFANECEKLYLSTTSSMYTNHITTRQSHVCLQLEPQHHLPWNRKRCSTDNNITNILAHSQSTHQKAATIKREMALDGCAIKCLLFAFNDK